MENHSVYQLKNMQAPNKQEQPKFTGSQFWDDRFGQAEYVYGKNPNAFFKEMLDPLAVGKLLLPAEGEGRNAVYAAEKGWEVTAIDFSKDGQQKALALARERRVAITYEVADITTYQTVQKYDLIAFVFAHLSPDIRVEVYRSYFPFLEKGGRVVAEFFNKKQLGKPSGGPKILEWLLDKSELAEIFKDLEIVYLEEVETELKEGAFHEGIANVVRLVAIKK